MNVQYIQLEGMRILDGTHEQLEEVKSAIEQHLNLSDYSDGVRPVVLNFATVMRIYLSGIERQSTEKPSEGGCYADIDRYATFR